MLLIVMDLTGSLTAGATTETRLRLTDGAPGGPFVEVEAVPSLAVLLASRRMLYTLSYLPHITVVDTGHRASVPLLLNEGEARVEGHGRHDVLSLSERVLYGDLNLTSAPIRPAEDGAAQALDVGVAPGIARLFSSTTTLSAQRTWRRWMVESSLGYQLSGGTDSTSEALLPYQSGPFAVGALGYALSRVSQTETEVSASSVSFSSGPRSTLVGIEQGLAHRWSRSMETRVDLGIVGAQSRTSDGVAQTNEAYPTAGVGVEHAMKHPDGSVELHLGLHLAPSVNRLLGFVDQRLLASIGFGYSDGAFTTRGFANASESVPAGSPLATGLLAAQVSETWEASEAVSMGVGLSGSRQRQPSPLTSLTQGTVFLTLTLRTSLARF